MGDRAVLVMVQDQPTVLAAIGPFVERHGLQMPAPATPLRAIAFVDVLQRLREPKRICTRATAQTGTNPSRCTPPDAVPSDAGSCSLVTTCRSRQVPHHNSAFKGVCGRRGGLLCARRVCACVALLFRDA